MARSTTAPPPASPTPEEKEEMGKQEKRNEEIASLNKMAAKQLAVNEYFNEHHEGVSFKKVPETEQEKIDEAAKAAEELGLPRVGYIGAHKGEELLVPGLYMRQSKDDKVYLRVKKDAETGELVVYPVKNVRLDKRGILQKVGDVFTQDKDFETGRDAAMDFIAQTQGATGVTICMDKPYEPIKPQETGAKGTVGTFLADWLGLSSKDDREKMAEYINAGMENGYKKYIAGEIKRAAKKGLAVSLDKNSQDFINKLPDDDKEKKAILADIARSEVVGLATRQASAPKALKDIQNEIEKKKEVDPVTKKTIVEKSRIPSDDTERNRRLYGASVNDDDKRLQLKTAINSKDDDSITDRLRRVKAAREFLNKDLEEQEKILSNPDPKALQSKGYNKFRGLTERSKDMAAKDLNDKWDHPDKIVTNLAKYEKDTKPARDALIVSLKAEIADLKKTREFFKDEAKKLFGDALIEKKQGLENQIAEHMKNKERLIENQEKLKQEKEKFEVESPKVQNAIKGKNDEIKALQAQIDGLDQNIAKSQGEIKEVNKQIRDNPVSDSDIDAKNKKLAELDKQIDEEEKKLTEVETKSAALSGKYDAAAEKVRHEAEREHGFNRP